MLLLGLEPGRKKWLWFQKSTAGLSRLNDFAHVIEVRKMNSNQPIHASNQNAVFEINPGHFKRPFQEPRHGTDSSLVLPNHTVLIVHRIVLFWEPNCCFQDGGQEKPARGRYLF